MKTATIYPEPPTIPNLWWRALSSADLSALKGLAAACIQTDGGLAFLLEPDALRGRYFPDTQGDEIGAFTPDAQLAACASVHILGDAVERRVAIAGLVRPDWRSQGIGTYLMKWSMAQASILSAGAPRPVVQIRTETLTDRADRLYRANGFAPVFEELIMQRELHQPLPEPGLEPDVALAPWHPFLEEQFFQAYDTSFRDRPGFPGWSAEEWIAWAVDDDLMPEWSLLALRSGVPLGFLMASKDTSSQPPGGYISQVGVIPEQRRRGLASALMVAAMQRMQSSGAPSVLLTVNTNNPGAIRAYEKLDFKKVGRRGRYERAG